MELGSQQELEQRLALAGPEDTLRGFFFNSALEVVRELGDEVALQRCREAAGGTRFMAFFSYPVSSLNRLFYAAAWALSARHGGFGEALRYLGHRVVPAFLESAAGRALRMLVGKEPKRLFNSLPSAYRTSLMHGTCSVRWTGPNSGTLLFRGNTLPMEFFEGALQGLFEAMRGPGVKVVGRRVSLCDSEFDISW
jgi:uncharacterized protein (TIGR02265 family)